MSFNRVPDGFMEGVFIAPHLFSDPQNPQHGQYVHLQMRNDLYYSTFTQISNVEFGLLPLGSQERIQVENFRPCQGEVGWLAKKASEYKKKRGRTLSETQGRKIEMIACQEWAVAHHKGKDIARANYRVHVMQSDTDIFKTEIFAPTPWRMLKDLLLN